MKLASKMKAPAKSEPETAPVKTTAKAPVNPHTAAEPYPTGSPVDQGPVLDALFPDRRPAETEPEPETAKKRK